MSNKNTISASIDDVVRLNENLIEILSKIHDSVSSTSSEVSLAIKDTDGVAKTIQFPTIGYLKSRLSALERNINTLAGIDGTSSVIQRSDNSYKRIIVSDLNVEPNDISNIDVVGTFKKDNNWFFDAMLNPSLSVEVDLTNKIQDGIRKVLSRRFIVEFEQDADGVYTTEAQQRIAEFNTKYNGNNDIDIVEFVSWLSSNGLSNRSNALVDEQMFDLTPQRLKYTGYFSVLGQQTDTLNDKLWYIVDSLNYQDVSNVNAAPVTRTLSPGDELSVVPMTANATTSTIYQVVEVSTATSELRIRLERVQGEEPVTSRAAGLRIYSPVTSDKKVKVSIGFDEYNVVFFKPFNADANLLAKNWSKGLGYYTSELRLDNTSGQFLKDFYDAEVYDYGAVLKDLVQKKIPNSKGVAPNTPVLYDDNFKVVQVNKHLTDTVNAEHIRKLNNDKNNLNAEIEQLRNDLAKQVKLIATKRFVSDDDRKQANEVRVRITRDIDTKSTQLATTVNEILVASKTNASVDRKYRLRGFVPFPESIDGQEVIQFEFWYRYSSKNNSSQPPVESVNVGTTANGTTGAISNWTPWLSDIRKRTYDKTTGVYTWEIENVSDADTPNINQLDLPIQPGEKIEFKARAISEVGWPDAKIYSEWSEIKTVTFPDDLSQVVGEDDFILAEATKEEVKVRFEKALDARGLGEHLSDGFTADGKYYPHNATQIASGFLDENGKIVNVFQKLTEAMIRIEKLEETIKRAKGELKVSIFNGTTEKQIANDADLSYTIELENLVKTAQLGTLANPITPTNKRTYANVLTLYKDIFVRIQNTAKDSPLGMLSSKIYTDFTQAYASSDAQAAWVNESGIIQTNQADATNNYNQQDYQWLWQLIKRVDGTEMFSYGDQTTTTPSAIEIHDVLVNRNDYNITLKKSAAPTVADTINLSTAANWEANSISNFAATLHGKISNASALVENSSDKTKLLKPGTENSYDVPLYLYYKFHTYTKPFNAYSVYSTNDTIYDEADRETIIQALLSNLNITGISQASNAVITFAANGTGYTTDISGSTAYSIAGQTNIHLTATNGEVHNIESPVLTSVTSSAYAIGEALTISGGDGNARVMVTKVYSSTKIAVVALNIRSLGYFGAVLNGQGYTTTTAQTYCPSNPTGTCVLNVTATNGAVSAITLSSSTAGTDYKIGDVLHITQSISSDVVASGAKAYVTGVSAGAVTSVSLITNELRLTINNDDTTVSPEIMNKVLKFNTFTSTTGSGNGESISTSFNSMYITAYSGSGALISTITDVVKTPIAASGIELWNTIGRDSVNNIPINRSLVVINSNSVSNSPVLKRTNRFYMEPENSTRPFQFSVTFNVRQYRDVNVISTMSDSGANSPATIG